MKRHLECAEQAKSTSNLTKYCACHAKWISWLIRVTYETSFRMRGASKVNLEPHQILCLPRKMNLMIDPRHIWNVISNTRSNQSQPRTSPNTAPATQNESHDWSAPHMKRHFQCAEQAKSTSNLSKYCACHAKWIPWLIRVTYGTSFTMRGATLVTMQHHQILRLPRNSEFKMSAETPWIVSANIKTIRPDSDDNPTIIRRYPNTKSSSRTRRFGDLTRAILDRHFVLKNTTFHAPAIYQNFRKCCACHEKWHSNFTKYCACHTKWISFLIRVTYETSFTMRGATRVTIQLQQILRLPLNCDFTDLLLYWTVTLLNCYCTLVNCYSSELLLYWTVTLLNCDWTVTWLSCYFSELLLYWTATLLNCYFTELLLYWTVTELLLDWAVTFLNCYFTELLLYWTVTLLDSLQL